MNKVISIFIITTLICISNANAQLLKKLKKAVETEVRNVVNEIPKKKKKETETKPNSENSKESNKGQPSLEKEPNLNDNEISKVKLEGMIFKAPNSNFQSFSIQKFKGLPRFGNVVLNRANVPKGYLLYRDMIISKYAKVYSESFYKHLITKELWAEYFTNEKDRDKLLHNYDYYAGRYQLGGSWGGSGSNQFERKRKQDDFKKKYIPVLEKWSSEFIPNDSQICYRVVFADIGEFDFENSGYWIRIPDIIRRTNSPDAIMKNVIRASFVPKNRYEKEIDGHWVLLKMGEEKAEQLSNSKIGGLYFVAKINFSFQKTREIGYMQGGGKAVDFKFNLESAIVECYSDQVLSKKIGELDITKARISNEVYRPNDRRNKYRN